MHHRAIENEAGRSIKVLIDLILLYGAVIFVESLFLRSVRLGSSEEATTAILPCQGCQVGTEGGGEATPPL